MSTYPLPPKGAHFQYQYVGSLWYIYGTRINRIDTEIHPYPDLPVAKGQMFHSRLKCWVVKDLHNKIIPGTESDNSYDDLFMLTKISWQKEKEEKSEKVAREKRRLQQ